MKGRKGKREQGVGGEKSTKSSSSTVESLLTKLTNQEVVI